MTDNRKVYFSVGIGRGQDKVEALDLIDDIGYTKEEIAGLSSDDLISLIEKDEVDKTWLQNNMSFSYWIEED